MLCLIPAGFFSRPLYVYLVLLLLLLFLLFLLLPLGAEGIRETLVSLQFLDLRQSVGLLGREISPSQGRYLTQTQNKRRYPYLEWDSNS
jgi:hypothetical protein